MLELAGGIVLAFLALALIGAIFDNAGGVLKVAGALFCIVFLVVAIVAQL